MNEKLSVKQSFQSNKFDAFCSHLFSMAHSVSTPIKDAQIFIEQVQTFVLYFNQSLRAEEFFDAVGVCNKFVFRVMKPCSLVSW